MMQRRIRGLARPPSLFYGWWIVVASCAMSMISALTFYGFTTFFDPIRVAFGWSSTAISVAFVFQRAEWGGAALLVGFLVDRFGPRRIVLVGATIGGIGYLLMATIQNLWTFYIAFLILSIGLSGAGPIVGYIAVAHWFVRQRSRAMAVLAVGAGLSGLLVPVLVWLIEAVGWRIALAVLGITTWLTLLPLALVFRSRPEDYGLLPDGRVAEDSLGDKPAPAGVPPGRASPQVEMTARQAIGTSAFWLLAVAFSLWFFVHGSLMVHIVPALTDAGISRGMAGVVAGAIPVLSLVGRLAFGIAADFMSKRLILAVALACMAIGTWLFSTIGGVGQIFLAASVYGIGFGGFIPVRAATQADYFGRSHFGTILGAMDMVAMTGGLTGPIFAGWVRDVTGSYHIAFLVFALAAAVAVPMILFMRPPKGLGVSS